MESSNTDRIIVLVDMDCFYVQVEQKLNPEYQNKPCAVVQYNTWKGGGIIAVNYEARAKGVTRFLRGDEAQKICSDIHLFRVPEVRGKADLTRYRDAGASVLDIISTYSDCVERASIDEAYLDLTSVITSKIITAPHVTADQLKNTFIVGWEGDNPEQREEEVQKWLQMIYEEEHLFKDRMLALAAVIVEEMRTAIYEKTGYRCSAGIAHNKVLAKLSCGIHKPNKQTVLPDSSINLLFKTIPIKKVRNLGGKLGEVIIKKFNVEKMGDLIEFPKSEFIKQFGEKTGHWLYNLVRGIDNEPVNSRQLPKSIGCGKNFPGKKSLSTRDDVIHWLKQLSTELEERLIKDQSANQRFAKLLTVSVRTHENNEFTVTSRSCPIHVYNAEKLAHDALLAVSKLNTSTCDTLWEPSIWTLSMAASKFEKKLDNQCDIQTYFSAKSVNVKDSASIESTSSTIIKSKTIESTNANLISIENDKKSDKCIINFFKTKQSPKTEFEKIAHACNNENDKCTDSDPLLLPTSLSNCISANITEKMSSAKTGFVESLQAFKDKNDKCKELDSSLLLSTYSESCIITNTNDNKIDEMKTEKNSIENSKNISEQNKPLGFFAKKLREKAVSGFCIEQNPCENNELSNKTYKTSESLSSTLKCISFDVSGGNNYSDLDLELLKFCDKCHKNIPIWEETEHLDYHLALDLSKEFSSKPSSSNDSSVSKLLKTGKNVTSKSKNSRKRGNLAKSSVQAKKSFIQTKTLDAFFK